MLRQIKMVAPTDSTVLIQGETGTGKELVARAIHDASARAGKPFVALNCGAIAETMIDSELFGHIRGSFTGATGNRPGLFVEADQGTIFLDEVAELPLSAQARLLRVLQEREVRPVGSDTPRKIDVRVVAATHVDLVAAVQAKRFREDLYHRLNVSSIQVPPLRERLSDIPLLVVTLLAKHAGQRRVHLTPAALTALSHYAYPGNVRELENALLHALALTAGDALDATTLPDAITNAVGKPRSAAHVEGVSWSDGLSLVEARKKATDDFERRYVLTLLGKTSGNLTQAARIAGLDRANFRRVMARLGIDAAQFREL